MVIFLEFSLTKGLDKPVLILDTEKSINSAISPHIPVKVNHYKGEKRPFMLPNITQLAIAPSKRLIWPVLKNLLNKMENLLIVQKTILASMLTVFNQKSKTGI